MTAGENEHQIGWEGRRRRRKGGKQASCSAEALRPCFPSLGPYFGVGSPEGFCRYCSVLGELQILDYAVMPFVFAVIGEGLYHWTSTTLLSNAICGTLRAAPQEAAPAFNLMNERVEVPAVWLGREPCLSTLFLFCHYIPARQVSGVRSLAPRQLHLRKPGPCIVRGLMGVDGMQTSEVLQG